ncbi:MAG: hypothetical protein JWP95_1259 [Actinotalea sp.]|nr:hypothetical protein [Actinotalea sp.]
MTVAAAACAAAIVVASVDPNEPGHYPTCPVLALTGFYCTGCGVLRAVHAVLHGDLAGGWAMNPAAFFVLPVVVASWVAWTIRAATGRPRSWLAPPWAVYTGVGALAAFTVARNLPLLAPWLAPGGAG